MTKQTLVVVALLSLLVGAGVSSGVASARAAQQASPNPDKLRFRIAGDEPIAAPDGRSIVPGLKAIVFRDIYGNQCYVAFVAGAAMSVTGPGVCPG
jgi:hypothetical protein